MKCRALFLYSAAVLLSLPPQAQAGAPAPEPDDATYIRACDAYGSGYFYIPGTQTCMRISGYLRTDLKTGDNAYANKADNRHRDTYAYLTRATLRFATASQTDWGPLRSFMELRSDWQGGAELGSAANSGAGAALRFGYIELGGLRVGIDENIFSYWTGYYGNMINDDIMNPAEKRTNSISYTYNAASGFSAILGVEQGNNNKGNGAIPDKNSVNAPEGEQSFGSGRSGGYRFRADGSKAYRALSSQTENYSPYVSAGLKYSGGWGSVSTVFGYDSYDSEWAAKLRFDANLTGRFSLFLMGGYKSMDDYYNLDSSYGTNGARIKTRADGSSYKRYGLSRQINSMYGDWGGHGIVWLGGTYKFSPQMSFNFQNAYSDDRNFATSANLTREVVSGLTLIGELTYRSWQDNYGYKQANGDVYRNSLKGQDAVQGVVRLQRSF